MDNEKKNVSNEKTGELENISPWYLGIGCASSIITLIGIALSVSFEKVEQLNYFLTLIPILFGTILTSVYDIHVYFLNTEAKEISSKLGDLNYQSLNKAIILIITNITIAGYLLFKINVYLGIVVDIIFLIVLFKVERKFFKKTK